MNDRPFRWGIVGTGGIAASSESVAQLLTGVCHRVVKIDTPTRGTAG